MTKEEIKYKKMTETPEWRLILGLAVPTTISMLITTIYNTADTFFVSKISVSASGATGIVFALMAILQAFGFMYGHGAGANISRLLGAKKHDHANVFASTSFFMAIATGLLIGIGGLIFLTPLMNLLGSTPTILPEARAYARFILIAAPAMTTSCVLNNILRYEGIPIFAMFGLASGGILNMILDPLFIFGLHLGTSGAGLATAISQYVSIAILLFPFMTGKTITRFSPANFTHSFGDILNIFLTGLPNMLRQGLTSVGTALLNTKAAMYGDAAIAAMSIVNRCTGLMFSLALGLGQGFQPVAAFNYGAKKFKRVKNSFLFTLFSGILMLGILTLLCRFCAEAVIMIFRSETEVVTIGAETLRFSCIGLLFLPLSAVGSMLFQSTGQKGRAIFISMLQSGAVFIPMLLTLPRFFGLQGLEASQPSAYVVAGLVTVPLCVQFLKEMGK